MSEPDTPRQFALLGSQIPSSLETAILESKHHEVVALALTDRRTNYANDVRLYDDWESIVKDAHVDAVIVCDARVETLDFARHLASRGKPLIAPVRTSFPPEFVAELGLFDAEGASTLVPWFSRRRQIEPLLELVGSGRIGSVTSVQLDRSGSDFEGDDRQPAWYAGVLFDDIDWLRRLGGDYSQVTLIRAGGDARNSFVTQTLQLSGTGLPDAICTYRRTDTPSDLRIFVQGSSGTAEVRVEGEGEDSELILSLDGAEFQKWPEKTDGDQILAELDRSWKQESGSAQWRDFVRVHEISEAMQRSLRRRRTIDLHFETASE